mgnify:FL=1
MSPTFTLPELEKETLRNRSPYQPTSAEQKAKIIENIEEDAGDLKPFVQFFNALSSPDTTAGLVVGPVNAVSKLGNALGDLAQKKEIDVSDAWTISDETARKYNPARLGGRLLGIDQGVNPADEAGLDLGGELGGEIIGLYTGASVLNKIKRLGFLVSFAKNLKKAELAKKFAVAYKGSEKVRKTVNASKFTGEFLFEASFAAPFLDQEQGNILNIFDNYFEVPGRKEETDNYLTGVGKSIFAEGVLLPLTLVGAGSLIGPVRRYITSGSIKSLDELAEAEIGPYIPYALQPDSNLYLPPIRKGGELTSTPGTNITPSPGGDVVPSPRGDVVPSPGGGIKAFEPLDSSLASYDSAISRSLDENLQIAQVEYQRQRLKDMGLVEEGPDGQLGFTFKGDLNPEIQQWITAIREQRGGLIRQANQTGQDLSAQLDELDKWQNQILETGLGGRSNQDLLDARPPIQLDIPDPRPEADSYLAALDELSDNDLRAIFDEVDAPTREAERQIKLETAEAEISNIEAKITDIETRRENGKLTDRGAKRLINKAQKDLVAAQEGLDVLREGIKPIRTLVGDQLELAVKGELAKAPPVEVLDFNWTQPNEAIELARREAGRKGVQRMINAVDRAFGKPWKSGAFGVGPLAALDNGISLLNIGRVAIEETVQKGVRDINKATTSPSGRRLTTAEQIPGGNWLLDQARVLRDDIGKTLPGTVDEVEPPNKFLDPSIPPTVDEYRNSLFALNRDDLRKFAAPTNAPEIAAIVKARTGRRVWRAKKEDIVEAFVEYYETTGRWGGVVDALDEAPELNVPKPQGELDLPSAPTTSRMGRITDPEGVESVVPMVDYKPRGMDMVLRERIKKRILEEAINNGEVQAPFSNLPGRPDTKFNQSDFIDELFADETGQLPLQYATDQFPTYKAGNKNAGALIEELRLRYDYQLRDAAYGNALNNAEYLDQNWDKMSWETKKRAGFGQELFTPQKRSIPQRTPKTYRESNAYGTTEFKAELKPTPPRKPQTYEWTPDKGVVPEEVAKKPIPPEVKKVEKSATSKELQAKKQLKRDLQLRREELAKKKQRLADDSQGASC